MNSSISVGLLSLFSDKNRRLLPRRNVRKWQKIYEIHSKKKISLDKTWETEKFGRIVEGKERLGMTDRLNVETIFDIFFIFEKILQIF